MTNTAYIVLCSGFFAFSLVALSGYFAFRERKDFLVLSDTLKKSSLEKAGSIQAFLLIISLLLLYFFSPDKTWFEQTDFLLVCALTAGFGFIGINISEKKITQITAAVLQLAGITAAIFLFPEGTSFFHTGLPLLADNCLAVIAWFIYFRLLFRLDRLAGFTLENIFGIGLTCFLALFLGRLDELPFFRASGLLLPASAALFPFYLLGYRLPMKGAARNVFCFASSWFSFYLISQGNWGTGVLLMAYPLLEAVVFSCRFLKSFLTKKKPVFLYETLLERGFDESSVVRFIFRRNIIICALALLSLSAQMQYQPVILGTLFLLDFYVRIVSPTKSDTSLRGLFKQIAGDAKEGFKETDKAFNVLKERYKENKKENNDKE